MKFRVDQIDHAELIVSSRIEAARWYQRVLGLEIVCEFQRWADDPHGPLMIGTAAAGTKIALFEKPIVQSRITTGFQLLAFRVDGRRFLDFLSNLEDLAVLDREGNPVTRGDAKDHHLAFSIYFCDPWGNALEITTYDHATVRHDLQGGSQPRQ